MGRRPPLVRSPFRRLTPAHRGGEAASTLDNALVLARGGLAALSNGDRQPFDPRLAWMVLTVLPNPPSYVPPRGAGAYTVPNLPGPEWALCSRLPPNRIAMAYPAAPPRHRSDDVLFQVVQLSRRAADSHQHRILKPHPVDVPPAIPLKIVRVVTADSLGSVYAVNSSVIGVGVNDV